MGSYLYLDIETLPTADVFVMAEIEDSILPPGTMSKPETIEAWRTDTKPKIVAEAIAKTALSGAWGNICCIAWAWDDGDTQATLRTASELEMLAQTFSSIELGKPHYGAPSIVGHNVANFDIRFIWQRAFVLGLRLPGWFPRDPKPWSREVQDTMGIWSGAKDFISLDKLCKAMGLRGKQGMNGSDVAAAWAAGEYEEVAAYCRQDVERVRAVHRKMLVATGD